MFAHCNRLDLYPFDPDGPIIFNVHELTFMHPGMQELSDPGNHGDQETHRFETASMHEAKPLQRKNPCDLNSEPKLTRSSAEFLPPRRSSVDHRSKLVAEKKRTTKTAHVAATFPVNSVDRSTRAVR